MLWGAILFLLMAVLLLAVGLWRVAKTVAALELRLEAEEKGWNATYDKAEAAYDKVEALDRDLRG